MFATEIADAAYDRCHAYIGKLPEGERADDFIFGLDELWNLVLHVLIVSRADGICY